nr:integrase core domain-containing protein [Stenotrophomonas sp. MMGLT7]
MVQALINRFGTLGREEPFLLRSDNGLVFTSRDYTRLVRSYGLKQESITPHCPQQNGMVERVIHRLKKQCVHRHRQRHRFESQSHALRVIGDLIGFYNRQRPHQALKMKTPDQVYATTLTMRPVQNPLVHYFLLKWAIVVTILKN